MPSRARHLPAVAIVLGAAALGLLAAEPVELSQSISGLTVRLHVLDPQADGSDPTHILERELHRDTKSGGKTYHVLIEAYDTVTGIRPANIDRVTGVLVDGHGQTPPIRLEPMATDGMVGYGNYFDFGEDGPYQILVAIWLHGRGPPATFEFVVAHLPQ